jgi:hypothetical protein
MKCKGRGNLFLYIWFQRIKGHGCLPLLLHFISKNERVCRLTHRWDEMWRKGVSNLAGNEEFWTKFQSNHKGYPCRFGPISQISDWNKTIAKNGLQSFSRAKQGFTWYCSFWQNLAGNEDFWTKFHSEHKGYPSRFGQISQISDRIKLIAKKKLDWNSCMTWYRSY